MPSVGPGWVVGVVPPGGGWRACRTVWWGSHEAGVWFGWPSPAFESPPLGCFLLGFGVVAGGAEGLPVAGVVGAASGVVDDVVGSEGAAGGVVVSAAGGLAGVVVAVEDGLAEGSVLGCGGSGCASVGPCHVRRPLSAVGYCCGRCASCCRLSCVSWLVSAMRWVLVPDRFASASLISQSKIRSSMVGIASPAVPVGG